MNLFEYQAKDVFRELGIPVLKGQLVRSVNEVSDALETVGIPCVIKAQVLRGGRGKAGLIKAARTREEALTQAAELFAHPEGVKSLLIEELVDIKQELYLSLTVDPRRASIVIISCAKGGVDIEQLAAEKPESVSRIHVDPLIGIQPFQMRMAAYRLGAVPEHVPRIISILGSMYKAFCSYDAELVEINPLFITQSGELTAGDGKMVIDDNASFRQKRFTLTKEHFSSETEYEAAREGIPYLQFDGDISLMCAGAGLTTVVYDLINYAGGSVANYLEFGGPNYRKAVRAMELCLKNPSKVILIVTFGTIARADVMAQGLVDAIRELKPDRPVVACIRGTNEQEAIEILRQAGIDPIFDTEEAVLRAVELAKRRGSA